MVSESDKDKTINPNESSDSPKQVSHILDEVLEEPTEIAIRHNRHPFWVDIMLALCLLGIMTAFSAGLIKMYITHSAEQSIIQRNYPAAIGLLDGAPFPDLFSPPGSEPRELLNQALYLDAMERLNNNNEDQTALKELEKIDASSGFFELAQETLKAHFKPSAVQLQGGEPDSTKDVQHTQPVQEKSNESNVEKTSIPETSADTNTDKMVNPAPEAQQNQ